MRIFVGYGYNQRDAWVEQHVAPILHAMSIDTVDGKDMHGEVLQEGVKNRIDIADAVIGFCTLREGQEKAAFNTHVWVRDELMYALGAGKPIVEVREQGVNDVEGLKGNRQYIPLDQQDRLSCVKELVQAVAGWSMRRLLLVPSDQEQGRRVLRAHVNRSLNVNYRSRINGIPSQSRSGRLERQDNSLYLDAIGLPSKSFVEIEGTTTTDGVLFNTGWVSADLVRIEF